MKKILEIINSFLDLIYRKRCYFCNSSSECVKMCSRCYDMLEFSDYRINREILGVRVYTASVYEKYMQKMIRGVKYHGQKELAYYQAKFMWEYFSELIEKEKLERDYQVVPVPLYKSRQKKRGYNHMELVGEEFCNLSGFTLNKCLVQRVKSTKPQYKLSRAERMKNLEKAFRVDTSKLLNKPILIIDDICTTGSTFESMIEEFNSHGISNITCLATSSPN